MPGRCQAAAGDLGLAGKTTFVTGGSADTGLAVAHALRDEGATVTVCGRDPDRLEASGLPGVRADVTGPDAPARAVDEAAERMGGLDLLVANADGLYGGGLLDPTPEDWLRTCGVSLRVDRGGRSLRAVPAEDSVLLREGLIGLLSRCEHEMASAFGKRRH